MCFSYGSIEQRASSGGDAAIVAPVNTPPWLAVAATVSLCSLGRAERLGGHATAGEPARLFALPNKPRDILTVMSDHRRMSDPDKSSRRPGQRPKRSVCHHNQSYCVIEQFVSSKDNKINKTDQLQVV